MTKVQQCLAHSKYSKILNRIFIIREFIELSLSYSVILYWLIFMICTYMYHLWHSFILQKIKLNPNWLKHGK